MRQFGTSEREIATNLISCTLADKIHWTKTKNYEEENQNKNLVYKAVASALLPVLYSDELLVPEVHRGSMSQHLGFTSWVETEAIANEYSENETATSQILMS